MGDYSKIQNLDANAFFFNVWSINECLSSVLVGFFRCLLECGVQELTLGSLHLGRATDSGADKCLIYTSPRQREQSGWGEGGGAW